MTPRLVPVLRDEMAGLRASLDGLTRALTMLAQPAVLVTPPAPPREVPPLQAALDAIASAKAVLATPVAADPPAPPRPEDERAKKRDAMRAWRAKQRQGKPAEKAFPPPVERERVDQARQIFAKGGSYREIQKATGLSHSTIIRYRNTENWTRDEGAAVPQKGRPRQTDPAVIARGKALWQGGAGYKATAARLEEEFGCRVSAGAVEAWCKTDRWQRLEAATSEIGATPVAKAVDDGSVTASEPPPPPPPAFLGRTPSLRTVADWLFDALRSEGVGQPEAMARVRRLSDAELLDQANHRRGKRGLALFGPDGRPLKLPVPVPAPPAVRPAPAPPVVHHQPREAPPAPRQRSRALELSDERIAAIREDWANPELVVWQVARRAGLTETQMEHLAGKLGLGPKAGRSAPHGPREASPPDTTALEPSPATVDTAQDWLIEDLVRERISQAEAEDRVIAMPPAKLFAEVNRRRLAHGLSPYVLSQRAA